MWINTRNSPLAASVWGIAIFLLGLMFNGFTLSLVIGAGLSFLICAGILALVDYLEGSGFQWVVGIIGLGVLGGCRKSHRVGFCSTIKG
ncbi:MAG: hypothetical protein P8179_09005 [Candidatus Thiodiazotropha sp.]